MRVGNTATAHHAYRRAADLYRGDLCLAPDAQTIIECERLRSRYLMVLAQLAEHYFLTGDYITALDYLWRLLKRDPYREDAHRLVMRCHVRLGQRAAALHHYEICVDILHAAFDAAPEAATVALFEQIRREPDQM
jgi:DNA-binding SARP family transcriptional activator